MKRLACLLLLAACTSPEAERTRGGGQGADVGNRGNPVVMHEGSRPYARTPNLIDAETSSLEGATQARKLSLVR